MLHVAQIVALLYKKRLKRPPGTCADSNNTDRPTSFIPLRQRPENISQIIGAHWASTANHGFDSNCPAVDPLLGTRPLGCALHGVSDDRTRGKNCLRINSTHALECDKLESSTYTQTHRERKVQGMCRLKSSGGAPNIQLIWSIPWSKNCREPTRQNPLTLN